MMAAPTPAAPDDHPNPYQAPASDLLDAPVTVPPGAGGTPLRLILIYNFFGTFIFAGAFFALFLSFFLSWLMNQDFQPVLALQGWVSGLYFGLWQALVSTTIIGLYWPRVTGTIPFRDRSEFVARLEGLMKKGRFRMGRPSEWSFVFVPRTWFFPDALYVLVEVGDREASVDGPRGTVKLLARKLRGA
jgi:hypothetical protein